MTEHAKIDESKETLYNGKRNYPLVLSKRRVTKKKRGIQMKKLTIATMACGVLLTTACSKPSETNETNQPTEQQVVESNVAIETIGMAIKEAVVNFWNDDMLQLEEGKIPGWQELDLKDELATSMYPMFADLAIEGTIYVPMMNVKSDLIVVVKATDGNVEAVQAAFEQLKQNQEDQWSQYLPDQYEKVKANKVTTSGDYVLYATFDDTTVVETAFLDTISGK